MTWQILGPEDYLTSRWSGGTTTQIAIAPAGADYGRRDFLWRVSSALVEQEESDFTALPDYTRQIAVLEGEIRLRHNEGEEIRLSPLQVHGFDGGDRTRSRGRCRDFNLMLRKGAAEGELEALCLRPGESRSLPSLDGAERLLFCVRGACAARDGERLAALPAGRTLRFDGAAELAAGAAGAVLMQLRFRLL